TYGFGETVDKISGPAFTSVGIWAGPRLPSEKERFEIRCWTDELRATRRFERGFLRSVFPLNVLSSMHLERRIRGSDLTSEISPGQLPGALIPIRKELAVWLVPEAATTLAKSQLAAEGLLCC